MQRSSVQSRSNLSVDWTLFRDFNSINDYFPQAIIQWIEQMDFGLTGKKGHATSRKKEKWYLSPDDWQFLEDFDKILLVRY